MLWSSASSNQVECLEHACRTVTMGRRRVACWESERSVVRSRRDLRQKGLSYRPQGIPEWAQITAAQDVVSLSDVLIVCSPHERLVLPQSTDAIRFQGVLLKPVCQHLQCGKTDCAWVRP
jgi:hypothetical protein